MQKHIYCSAAMTPKLHDIFVSFILSQGDVEEYIIYLTSVGGVPIVGFNLYSFIKARPEKTTIYNMGNVDSAAVQFFLGFKKRLSTPTGTFMVHQTTFSKDFLPQNYSRFDVQKALNELTSLEVKTEQIILAETTTRAQTPFTIDQVRAAIFQTTVIQAPEALSRGIIDAIVEPVFPTSDVLYLTETYLAQIPMTPPVAAPPSAP